MFHVVHVHDLDKCKYVVNNGSVLSLTSSVVTYLYKKKKGTKTNGGLGVDRAYPA